MRCKLCGEKADRKFTINYIKDDDSEESAFSLDLCDSHYKSLLKLTFLYSKAHYDDELVNKIKNILKSQGVTVDA